MFKVKNKGNITKLMAPLSFLISLSHAFVAFLLLPLNMYLTARKS